MTPKSADKTPEVFGSNQLREGETIFTSGNGAGLYLHWIGKQTYRQRMPTPRLLEPVPDLSTGAETGNMIVEGDNLQVLASLRGQYGGMVDVVYIDPPYNMGKDDFRYSDRRFEDPDADGSDAVYVRNEDGGRHTKWLNFMAPRLYMLWHMLHDDRGVIFVSINDVELFRLGMLLDEIFGEENRVGVLIWKGITDNNPTNIATEHEYVLCYAKNRSRLTSKWSSPDSEAKSLLQAAYEDIKTEAKSLAEIERRIAEWIKEHRVMVGELDRYRKVDDHGLYSAQRNLHNPGKPGYFYDIEHPTTGKPCKKPATGWRFPESSIEELRKKGKIIFGKDETQVPQLKVYLDEVGFPLRSVIEVYSGAGANELERLFGRRDMFRNPKPVELIERLLEYSTTRDSLVLDAFAGSGTTAQALLALNHRDGGNRHFILIEEGSGRDRFARSLTGERVKRAIAVYGYQGGFEFFKTGRKVDRKAIAGLEREALADLICQVDETGRGKGIVRLTGHKYIIGRNSRAEAICLVWNGSDNSEVLREHLREASAEVKAAGLKKPFRIYGTHCRVDDTPSWKFCQIPDEILAQMYIQEDLDGTEDTED